MVVFVKRTVRRRGDKFYEYLSLVEAVREDGRNTHHTLLRLGEVSELRSSGQIDRIIRALRAYAEGTWFEAGELSGELSHVQTVHLRGPYRASYSLPSSYEWRCPCSPLTGIAGERSKLQPSESGLIYENRIT